MTLPEPSEKLPLTRAIWHYARGVAAAAKHDLATAKAERKALEDGTAAVPADEQGGAGVAVAKLAGIVLDARIARAEGDSAREIALWRSAVEAQDALAYDEPPDWYYSVRESLGAALLRNGMASEAERVFRDDLDRNPRNGRSLFGLVESLRAQNKTESIDAVRPALEAAWKDADVELSVDSL
jgi:hypothetical protein